MLRFSRIVLAALFAVWLSVGPTFADTILKQATAITVAVGPFVDSLDGVTPETAVTLAAADQAELLKANGAATVDISARTFTAITGAGGWYHLSLSTADTDTIGELVVVVQDASVALPVRVRLQVVEESVYDNFYASGAVGALTAAQVNVEVQDVLTVDTSVLPGQVAPPATPTLEEMITWLYKNLRNKKTQTSGPTATWSLFDDAGTTVDAKSAVSDDGTTFTREEIVVGP